MSRSVTCSRVTTTPTSFSFTVPWYCKRGNGEGQPHGPRHPAGKVLYQNGPGRAAAHGSQLRYHGGVKDRSVVIGISDFHDGSGSVGQAIALLVCSLDDQRVVGSGLQDKITLVRPGMGSGMSPSSRGIGYCSSSLLQPSRSPPRSPPVQTLVDVPTAHPKGWQSTTPGAQQRQGPL